MQAVRNKGYRIENASDPLSAERILEAVGARLRARVTRLEVAWSLESTNTALVSRPNPQPGESEILLAEFQTAGRGRRGRQWIAPPGGAICLSLSWTFPQMPRDAGALSLAMGVCVLRALKACDVADARLKWPNDILVGDRKLGGILIELRAESAGPACAVIGIGLNVALGAASIEKIATTGLPATDLASVCGKAPSRNAVAARVIENCLHGLMDFEREGLPPFLDEWQQADALRGRAIDVHGAGEGARGLARGIDIGGALLVETPQGLKKFVSGDVSVRPVA